MMKGLRDFLISTASGVAAAAIGAYLAFPTSSVDLSSLGMGLAYVATFVVIFAAAAGLLALYTFISVLDFILTHLGWFDGADLDGFG